MKTKEQVKTECPKIERPMVDVETRGLVVTLDQGTFFLGLTADEMVMVCCKLQEALIRRATHDGFMRRSTYDKP